MKKNTKFEVKNKTKKLMEQKKERKRTFFNFKIKFKDYKYIMTNT